MYSFLSDISVREGIPELGLCVGEGPASLEKALIPSVAGPLFNSPTLLHALQRLPSIGRQQNTHLRSWLELNGDLARFCLSLPFSRGASGQIIGETRTLELVKKLVSVFAGPDFRPTRIFLAAPPRQIQFDLEAGYQGTPVTTGHPYSAIEFPRALLCSTRASPSNGSMRSTVSVSDETPPATFVESLEACLDSYLLDGYPSIDLAAEIMCCSKRRLQRGLTTEGTTYREIVEKVRCLKAVSHLSDDEISVAELALMLGYSEHSAFTRAFRRWTGASPSDYRERVTQKPSPIACSG